MYLSVETARGKHSAMNLIALCVTAAEPFSASVLRLFDPNDTLSEEDDTLTPDDLSGHM